MVRTEWAGGLIGVAVCLLSDRRFYPAVTDVCECACLLFVYLRSAVTNDATTQQSESPSTTIVIHHDDERRETHVSHQTIVVASAWDAR